MNRLGVDGVDARSVFVQVGCNRENIANYTRADAGDNRVFRRLRLAVPT